MRQPVLAAVVIGAVAALASAQLRVAAWNVTNYGGGRVVEFQTALYGSFEGRSMSPDVILGCEFLSLAGVNSYLSILNTAPGSPGDWAAAPFIDGPDTDDAFFYRTSRFDFLGVTVVAPGGVSPNHPRNIQRYDVRLRGYAAPEAIIACYPTHMKSGNASEDQARRLVEAQRVRDDAAALPPGWSFILGGDLNIQSASQAAYQELIGSQVDNAGRFFDPIATPGSWNNNSAYRFVHTQDPVGAGGMDDRHDQILLSAALIDGAGLEYIGNPAIPYSAVTWDDPNHSYRAWGNDGTSFDAAITVTGNAMVGATIAQALRSAASTAGHLPVFLDLRVPPRIDSESVIDFGTVAPGALAQATLHIGNSGDVALWGASGVAALNYTLAAPAGFATTAGPFADAADGVSAAHVVTMDTVTPGPRSGVLLIASDAPDEPVRAVMLLGAVSALCAADLDGSGAVGAPDLALLLGAWGATGAADLDGSGAVGAPDLALLLGAWGPCK